MEPLLAPPGVRTAPVETLSEPAPALPPPAVRALQLLLIGGAAVVVWIWLWTWSGVQAYAWPGVDNGLTERGLAYLLVLGPAVPVNLLAAIWLSKGGRRAQLYLAAAGALAAVQLVVLFTPAAMPVRLAMTDGGTAVGIRFLFTVVPILFLGIVLAAGTPVRGWLHEGPDRPLGRVVSVELAVWGLALVLALGAGTEVRAWASTAAEPKAPVGDFTEADTWQRLETAAGETVAALPAFNGFAARALEVAPCGYHTTAGLPAYRYLLTYEFRAADFPTYETVIAERWTGEDYMLTYDGATLEGTTSITATRTDAITLAYTGGDRPALHLESSCVERTDTPPCLPPQGAPTTDDIKGIRCPELI
ncbi:hypothetical protein AB0B28_05590 [Glycomyces sp. NPDC046736]|uniref:hypothetical protein n=1 Tax=Glycomyces sp. NPDC046736 TaxID=3155615 RepID=UPI0033C64C04